MHSSSPLSGSIPSLGSMTLDKFGREVPAFGRLPGSQQDANSGQDDSFENLLARRHNRRVDQPADSPVRLLAPIGTRLPGLGVDTTNVQSYDEVSRELARTRLELA